MQDNSLLDMLDEDEDDDDVVVAVIVDDAEKSMMNTTAMDTTSSTDGCDVSGAKGSLDASSDECLKRSPEKDTFLQTNQPVPAPSLSLFSASNFEGLDMDDFLEDD
jgi:hypothetical protein